MLLLSFFPKLHCWTAIKRVRLYKHSIFIALLSDLVISHHHTFGLEVHALVCSLFCSKTSYLSKLARKIYYSRVFFAERTKHLNCL